ncbi:MAG: disulfide bond formation protein B [Proteobacteria bacterium]|nr:disulfide bond formation protein B [Pseudomonadota bacterium]MBI3499423.1 disulfide bond formation protein B [Pseudomonadota bacterium]
MKFLSELDALPPRAVPSLVLAASALVLGTALASQYVGGLQPCVLCLYQRYPYWIAIALSVLALAAMRMPGGRRASAALVGLAGVGFLAGAAIALFHVGVEQHWWAGTAECGTTLPAAASAAQLKAQLLAQPVVRCDEVAWSLFGVSMAGFNVLVSLGLTAFAGLGAKRLFGHD